MDSCPIAGCYLKPPGERLQVCAGKIGKSLIVALIRKIGDNVELVWIAVMVLGAALVDGIYFPQPLMVCVKPRPSGLVV